MDLSNVNKFEIDKYLLKLYLMRSLKLTILISEQYLLLMQFSVWITGQSGLWINKNYITLYHHYYGILVYKCTQQNYTFFIQNKAHLEQDWWFQSSFGHLPISNFTLPSLILLYFDREREGFCKKTTKKEVSPHEKCSHAHLVMQDCRRVRPPIKRNKV